MGAGVSTGYETSPAGTYGSATRKGHVVAFHSSKTWKIHFEASKQTPRLVKIVFCYLLVLIWYLNWCEILTNSHVLKARCRLHSSVVRALPVYSTCSGWICRNIHRCGLRQDWCWWVGCRDDDLSFFSQNTSHLCLEKTDLSVIIWTGCGTGIRNSDNADFRANEERERGRQGCRSQEGRPEEEDWQA